MKQNPTQHRDLVVSLPEWWEYYNREGVSITRDGDLMTTAWADADQSRALDEVVDYLRRHERDRVGVVDYLVGNVFDWLERIDPDFLASRALWEDKPEDADFLREEWERVAREFEARGGFDLWAGLSAGKLRALWWEWQARRGYADAPFDLRDVYAERAADFAVELGRAMMYDANHPEERDEPTK